MSGSLSAEPDPRANASALWSAFPILAATGMVFFLYFWTAAPGLSWSHFGADGGELLAAAVTRGVAHPPGYPLYTLLLHTWLRIGHYVTPTVEIARLGNLLSVVLAASSVPPVIMVVHTICDNIARKWQIPLLIGLLWALSPLLWQQALVTEVYALHIALVAWFGYLLLTESLRPWPVTIVTALGLANHGTFALLLPSAIYLIITRRSQSNQVIYWSPVAGILGAALFYLYIPLAAAAEPPPPVNWGYADNWQGFAWLVSGVAYRQYLFGVPATHILGRLAGWAGLLATQYTAAGMAIALLGLSEWDRFQPRLRSFGLLWMLPISIYAVSYNTQDSNIYLLPVTWLCAILLGVGANWLVAWLHQHRKPVALPTLLLVLLILFSLLTRTASISLRGESEARSYIAAVAQTLEVVRPAPILVSSTDRQTFALWYGAWATGELLRIQPDLILVNSSLYPYSWYRRLLADYYPRLRAVDADFMTFVEHQHDKRPVLFTEPWSGADPDRFEAVGALWKYAR